jgi:hypothetical protein
MRHLWPIALAALLTVTAAGEAAAEMVRLDIVSRSDVLNAMPVGSAGAYERIIGKAIFAIDPTLPRNRAIPNVDLAPRNAQGRVELSADVYIIAPKDPAKGNGVALFEVPNRGNRGLFNRFSRAARGATGAEEFGDRSLLESGYTLVWVGWQFSLPRGGALLGIDLPLAIDHGKPLTGRVHAPFIANAAGRTLALDPDSSRYPPLDIDSPTAQLTVTSNVYAPETVIPRARWRFANVVDGKVVPDPKSVYLEDGFQPGYYYELSYDATGTPVGGLAYAALRDAVSAMKQGRAGLPRAKYAYVFGESQTGRVLREFLYRGFNEDERGQKAFDAVWVHIAGAARGDFIEPFSLPNGQGIFTGSMFPFADAPQRDPVTGRRDGLLAHTGKQALPKVFYTNGSPEYWGGGRAAALIHTTPNGMRDLQLPSNVRVYAMAGTQHITAPFPPQSGAAQQLANPNDYNWILRAGLVALDAWVRKGTPPPPSRYATLAAGTLVPHTSFVFPTLPGVQSPSIIPGGFRADLGDSSSPKLPFLVPRVDADGNEVDGIRLPEIAVPLATYTGWNFRRAATGQPNEIVPLTGSFIPFAATRAGREQNGDPRLSIAERYASRDEYLAKVRASAQRLASERYILGSDVDAIVNHAGTVWDYVTTAATQ